MTRKEALYRVALLLGGTIISPQIFLTSCNRSGVVENDDVTVKTLNEIAGTVIPKTDTPSAKDANVAPVALAILFDCYSEEHQKLFKNGLKAIDQMATKNYGNVFTEISEINQQAVIKKVDLEERTNRDSVNPHYFKLMRELIVLSYFTSEIGCSQALRYLAIPGKFVGDYPYKKGDRAWATA